MLIQFGLLSLDLVPLRDFVLVSHEFGRNGYKLVVALVQYND